MENLLLISEKYNCVMLMNDESGFRKFNDWLKSKKNKNNFNIIIGSGDGVANKELSGDAVFKVVNDYMNDEITEIEIYEDYDIHINIGESNSLEKNAKYIDSSNKLSGNKIILILDITNSEYMDRFCDILRYRVNKICSNKASLMFHEKYSKLLLNKNLPDAKVLIYSSSYYSNNYNKLYNINNNWICKEELSSEAKHIDNDDIQYWVCKIVSNNKHNLNGGSRKKLKLYKFNKKSSKLNRKSSKFNKKSSKFNKKSN